MQIPVTLTEANVRKLINGHPIQLSSQQLHGTSHHLVVHPETHKRMLAAKAKKKGIRIHLTPEEVAASGQGFGDFLRKIGKAAKWVGEKVSDVIHSGAYQKYAKPLVKTLVSDATAAVAPMLGPLAGPVESGVQKLGEVTGAYGLPQSLPTDNLIMVQPVKGSGVRKSKVKVVEPAKAKKNVKNAEAHSKTTHSKKALQSNAKPRAKATPKPRTKKNVVTHSKKAKNMATHSTKGGSFIVQ